MLPDLSYRHDPSKSVLVTDAVTAAHRWATEPAVQGFHRFTHTRPGADAPLPVPLCATPVVVTGIGVVVGGYDGCVTFFDVSLSKVYWRRRLDAPVYASLVLDAERRTVIAASTKGRVACFDLRGRTVWSVDLGAPVHATPVLSGVSGILTVASFGSRCTGLDAKSGRTVFARDLPRPWHDGVAAHRDPYASPAVTPEGDVIVGCAEHLVRLSPEGDELWRTDLDHSVRSSPAVLGDLGEVAVLPVDGRCRFLDLKDGEPVAEVSLGGKAVASPAVSGAVLAAGTQDGIAFGIDTHTRKLLWTAPRGAPHEYTSFTVSPDGGFVATAGNGNAVALDRDDGRFRWESSQVLGIPEHEPAMDTTPVISPAGDMYIGSHSGMLYHFRFRPATSGETT